MVQRNNYSKDYRNKTITVKNSPDIGYALSKIFFGQDDDCGGPHKKSLLINNQVIYKDSHPDECIDPYSYGGIVFSHDRKTILFPVNINCGYCKDPTFSREVLFNLQSGNIKTLENVVPMNPRISPDGQLIAYFEKNNINLFDIATNKVDLLISLPKESPVYDCSPGDCSTEEIKKYGANSTYNYSNEYAYNLFPNSDIAWIDNQNLYFYTNITRNPNAFYKINIQNKLQESINISILDFDDIKSKYTNTSEKTIEGQCSSYSDFKFCNVNN